MPDIADLADDQIEMTIAEALRRRAPELKPTGQCYNCDEPVAHLFCDMDCREDWEKRQRSTGNKIALEL